MVIIDHNRTGTFQSQEHYGIHSLVWTEGIGTAKLTAWSALRNKSTSSGIGKVKELIWEGEVFLGVFWENCVNIKKWLREMICRNININEAVNISAFKLGKIYGERDIECY